MRIPLIGRCWSGQANGRTGFPIPFPKSPATLLLFSQAEVAPTCILTPLHRPCQVSLGPPRRRRFVIPLRARHQRGQDGEMGRVGDAMGIHGETQSPSQSLDYQIISPELSLHGEKLKSVPIPSGPAHLAVFRPCSQSFSPCQALRERASFPMAAESPVPPSPLSLEDAQRLWTLQKQNAPLSPADQKLLEQAAEWQMWVSHGIRLQNGKPTSSPNLQPSKNSRRIAAVL